MSLRFLFIVVLAFAAGAMAPASSEPKLNTIPALLETTSIDELIEGAGRHTVGVQLTQRYCCKHCTKGIPCGNTCISATKRCRVGPGCAC